VVASVAWSKVRGRICRYTIAYVASDSVKYQTFNQNYQKFGYSISITVIKDASKVKMLSHN